MGALVVTHHSSLIQLQTATKRSSPVHLHPSGFRCLLFSSDWTKCLCRYWVRLAISLGQVNPVSVGWVTEVCWLPLCSLETQHHPAELVGPWLVAWEWGESLRRDRAALAHSVGCWEVHCLCSAPTVGGLTLASIHSWSQKLLQGFLLSMKGSKKEQKQFPPPTQANHYANLWGQNHRDD